MTNKKVIIDKRMRKIEKKRIQDMGYEIIEIPTNKNVYTEISSHVDIFVCRVRDEIIVEPTQNFKDISNLVFGEEKVLMQYPQDIKYNVCIIGNFAIHNLKYTDKILKQKLIDNGFELVNTTQGYTNCSIAVIDENSAIVTDKGLNKILQKHGIKTLYLDEKLDIKLLNENEYSEKTGFIGGCISRIKNKIIVFGDLDKIDLDKLLEWDDIKLYSEIINIAETHPDSNVRDLATMTIPNMEAFLNMIYSHLDLKNRSKQDLSTQDLRFLQKIKSLRNPNFTDENTIFFDEQNSKVLQNQLHSIAPTLKNDTSLINTHLIFQRAYSPDEPIYIRDSNGKIYELSKHPKRKYDWNNISINSHSNFAYIPYLRSCGISENIISKLQNISTGISTYSIPKETYFPQVNMQPLQVGNSLESYFSKLDTSNER